MSGERDIDDILDSLNKLLREGESHNDDHVEVDAQAEEIEAELHELEEGGSGISEEVAVATEEAVSELSEAADISGRHAEADAGSVADPGQDEAGEPCESVEADSSDSSDAQTMEPVDAPVSVQRVVLTEEMLLDNPQGNLLSLVKRDEAEAAESMAEAPQQEAVRENRTPLHVDHHHMARLLDQVTDDVIDQLQQELPVLIKHSLYRHLAELRDAGDDGHQSESGSREE